MHFPFSNKIKSHFLTWQIEKRYVLAARYRTSQSSIPSGSIPLPKLKDYYYDTSAMSPTSPDAFYKFEKQKKSKKQKKFQNLSQKMLKPSSWISSRGKRGVKGNKDEFVRSSEQYNRLEKVSMKR